MDGQGVFDITGRWYVGNICEIAGTGAEDWIGWKDRGREEGVDKRERGPVV